MDEPINTSNVIRDRSGLQSILEEIFSIFQEADGHQHVYFQPPANIKLHYPCVVYKRDGNKPTWADNGKYFNSWSYQLIIIDQDPISSCINADKTKTIIDAISELPKCSYIRHYVVDNLDHDVFKIYYK
jgi:hypothetical protein